MTVKALMNTLKNYDENAEIVVYVESVEQDGFATSVKEIHLSKEYRWQAEEYGCNGDSIFAYHASRNPDMKAIAIMAE